MITYIGTGLLGSNFVKAFLKKNEEVNVWNRTFAKAKNLEGFGAKAFENITEAVKNAERIHLTLSDDAAVDATLELAKSGFKPGVIIIDHTTTSTEGATRRTAYWKHQGFHYLHAPVFMGPPNALDGTGYMLVSGDQELIQKVEPVLSGMTGKLLNFGTEVNRAAGLKLLGNSFLLFLTAGWSDVLALSKAMDVPSSDLVSLFDNWNPGAMAPARLQRILAADFANPSWELNMARKDARLMMEEANAANQHLAAIPAIAAEMDKWIDKGFGNNDWTVIAKDNV
ncbi:6-phosphogluconate dehydrogenase [Sphingobacteriaceae bacterium]|nr:6-phosphogluconate dehydrogenase [Sphingobacteriaceae bacterium]